MFKLLKTDKDCYITDKVVDGTRQVLANVGAASSLNLYKLYGITESASLPNIELSRLLVHFNLDPLRELVSNNKIDPNSSTFSCKLRLFNVDGGQTVPSNFTVTVNPLSKSFDEGIGKNIVLLDDYGSSNFLTASISAGTWFISGANSGNVAFVPSDYVTSFVENETTSSLEVTQLFVDGTEDLYVDVTNIVSATLANKVPDEGFRISLTSSLETDSQSYFVKRFASRSAFDSSYHPRLEIRFDDSVIDDSLNFEFDNDINLFLYNFNMGNLANLISSSIAVTGSIKLQLLTAVSGGFQSFDFTGSQHTIGGNSLIPVEGVYSASVHIPSTHPVIVSKILTSGSIDFIPIWGSMDGTVAYHTGSLITARQSLRGSSSRIPFTVTVSVTGINATHKNNELVPLRVNIFDKNSPLIKAYRIPVVFPGIVVRDTHYSIRCVDTGEEIIQFDTVTNSTRISSDGEGMFFVLDTSNLVSNKRYVVDILVIKNGLHHVYKDASPVFRITDTR